MRLVKRLRKVLESNLIRKQGESGDSAMQVGYEKWKMKVHGQAGTRFVVIPYVLCKRLKIEKGDDVIFERRETQRFFRFYKEATKEHGRKKKGPM